MTDRAAFNASYEAAPKRKRTFATMSGIELDPVYGPDDAELPGQYPYTRGIFPSMYRSKLWTMRQFAGFGSASDTNARFHQLLASGGTGLSTAFDMPTLLGRDSDDPFARGEVGKAGVAIDTVDDMATVATEDERYAHLIAVNNLSTLREALRASQSHIDALRTLAASHRIVAP